MPLESWFNIHFRDRKFLYSNLWSPAIAVLRSQDQFLVALSGPELVEPKLNLDQLALIEFLGWERHEDLDSHFSSGWVPRTELTQQIHRSLDCLTFIYGVDDSCFLAGSNEIVNEHLAQTPDAKYSRKYRGFKFGPSTRISENFS